MCWKEYIDEQICGSLPCKIALIAGKDGAVWARKDGEPDDISQEQLSFIAAVMSLNPERLKNGITLGREQYFVSSVENNLLTGGRGTAELSICLTKVCLVVAVSVEGVSPGSMVGLVKALGEYINDHH